jgi:c-di-GMP-related signal transduction protein
MELFIARQPIFDCRKNVVAYEMLYRSGSSGTSFDGTDGATATSKVINALFYSPEGMHLLNHKLAFINFPQSLLLSNAALAVPSRHVVLEILEDVEPCQSVVAACSALREKQYTFALDDVVDSRQQHALAELATYIKVDFRVAQRDECARIASRFKNGKTLIAEKIETNEEFQWAAAQGFSLFQGYFFSRPVTTSVMDIPGHKLNFLEILRRINEPEFNFNKLAALVRREASLSYKLLKAANSALYATREPARSVDRAMNRLGEDEVRKLLSIVVMIDLASDTTSEPMVNALTRARFAELLAARTCLQSRAGELFTAGLFSRLDAIIGRPLEEIIRGIDFPRDLQLALVNPEASTGEIAKLWSLLLSYEAGDWERALLLMNEMALEPEVIHPLYASSVQWANVALRH